MRNFDWKRLVLAVLCSLAFLGCVVAFFHYFPTAFLVFTILTLAGALTLTLYFIFVDVEERDE